MARLAALALLALPLLGCEIGLIVAAVSDEPTPDYYDPTEYTYCNEFSAFQAFSGTIAGVEGRSTLQAVGNGNPGTPSNRLAANEQLDFFLIATGATAGPDTTVEVVGDAERLDESSGTCVPGSGVDAASFVSLATAESGEISIVVLEDGIEFDRFDFEIARPEHLALNLGPNTLSATLTDGEGQLVFAHSGVEWQFIPANPAVAFLPPIGLTAPLGWDGLHSEMQVTVFFEDLEATTTLRVDPATGSWELAE